MLNRRATELLHNIVNNLLLCDADYTLIQYLLSVGFDIDELICEFEFDEKKVNEAMKNLDNFVDTLTFN